MFEDPIVEEVRKIREERARKLNFDIRAIVADARKRQVLAGRKLVSPREASRPTSSSTPERDET
jgi:hypothetical protein